MNDPYEAIRPYRDQEVAPVLARLLQDKELLGALASFRLGRLASLFPALCRPLVRRTLSKQLQGIDDVYGMQMVIKHLFILMPE